MIKLAKAAGCAALLFLCGCGGAGNVPLPGAGTSHGQPNSGNAATSVIEASEIPQLADTEAPAPADLDEALRQAASRAPELTRKSTSAVVYTIPQTAITVTSPLAGGSEAEYGPIPPAMWAEAQDTSVDSEYHVTGTVHAVNLQADSISYATLGVVNWFDYDYAINQEANKRYLFNQNVFMLVLRSSVDPPNTVRVFLADCNGKYAPSGFLTTVPFDYDIQLNPTNPVINTPPGPGPYTDHECGVASLRVNGVLLPATLAYGKNNWGWRTAANEELYGMPGGSTVLGQVYSSGNAVTSALDFDAQFVAGPIVVTPTPQWIRTYGGLLEDRFQTIAVDGGTGNVYAAGYLSQLAGGNQDVLIAQFLPDGSLGWVKTWGGVFDDAVLEMYTDGTNLNMVGYTNTFGAGGYDILLLQYDLAGNFVSSASVGTVGNEFGQSICYGGASGADYLVAGYDGSGGGLIAAVDADGSTVWDKVLTGVSPLSQIRLDPVLPQAHAVGYYDPPGPDLFSALLTKINTADGSEVYSNYFASATEVSQLLSLDQQGGFLYLAGAHFTGGPATGNSLLMRVAPSSGNLDWATTWGGANADYSLGVHFDTASMTGVATGISSSFGAFQSVSTLSFDASGAVLAADVLSHPTNNAGSYCRDFYWSTTENALITLGYAQDALGWSLGPASGITGTVGATWTSTSLAFANYGSTQGTAPGSEAVPVGTLDTGAGNWDALIAKIPEPGATPSGPAILINNTSYANGAFTVYSGAGVPLTGTLDSDVVFNAGGVLSTGSQFYIEFATDPLASPLDQYLYPQRPDGTAGGLITVNATDLTIPASLSLYFTNPVGTRTLVLNPAVYNRVGNDVRSLSDAMYVLFDVVNNSIMGLPLDSNLSQFQRVVLGLGTQYRVQFTSKPYPAAGSNPGTLGSLETIYPGFFNAGRFVVGAGSLTEAGALGGPNNDNTDYYTQLGLVNTLDNDAYCRFEVQCGPGILSRYGFRDSFTGAWIVVPSFPFGREPGARPYDSFAFLRGIPFEFSDGVLFSSVVTVGAGRTLGAVAYPNTLTLPFGPTSVDLEPMPNRVWDDPMLADPGQPGAVVTGVGPWQVPLNLLRQYNRPGLTLELDADYGGTADDTGPGTPLAWDDGAPGRVYPFPANPYGPTGTLGLVFDIPVTQPAGTYTFAVRGTDGAGNQYTYVWPNPVVLP